MRQRHGSNPDCLLPKVPGRISPRAAFSGSTVLLTGATGFLGTLVLDRLFAACPDVRRVYVVIRSRRGVFPTDRLKRLLDAPPFSTKWYTVILVFSCLILSAFNEF